MTAGYSGTPLPRKLGLTGENRALVVGSPPGFELAAAHHVRAGRAPYDVQLLFCPDRSQAARTSPAVYSLPWSVCRMTPAIASRPPRTATAAPPRLSRAVPG